MPAVAGTAALAATGTAALAAVGTDVGTASAACAASTGTSAASASARRTADNYLDSFETAHSREAAKDPSNCCRSVVQ